MESPDYIEEQARDKMDMFYPDERVYIAQQILSLFLRLKIY